MGELRKAQSHFARMVARLINYADNRGYEVTLGDAWAKKGSGRLHSPKSCHYKRLAVDLNLFKDGVYLQHTIDHQELGEYWESIGGTWGGRWNDGNHYSFGEKR